MTDKRGTRVSQAFRWAALVAAAIAYSVMAYRTAASATPDPLGALVAILPLAALALVMAWRSASRVLFVALWFAACAVLYAASDWLLHHFHWFFLIEHAGIYALLCTVFGRSLRAGHVPLVTGFASLVHSTMSAALLSYTRAVTWAWTIYFALVTMLSLLLFWLAPVSIWSAFANLLGLPLLALMFLAEYAVRCFVLPIEDRAGPLEAIRAYRQAWTSRSTQ